MPRGETNKEFYFYERNDDPVILEKPINYKPMTQESYEHIYYFKWSTKMEGRIFEA